MRTNFLHCAPALCAVVISLGGITGSANAQFRPNCPSLKYQTVIVAKVGPTAFRLHVKDLGEGTVSIFQWPLGGFLQQSGPSSLDFTFIPTADFGGSTTFTYRLTPPVGCPSGVLLGKVVLMGGVTDGTEYGLNDPPVEEVEYDPLDICGAGLPLILPMTVLSMMATRRRDPR